MAGRDISDFNIIGDIGHIAYSNQLKNKTKQNKMSSTLHGFLGS